MKKQILVLSLVLMASQQLLAADGLFKHSKELEKRCEAVSSEDLSVSISCYQESVSYLQKLNDLRMETLANDPSLKLLKLDDLISTVKNLRPATTAKESIYCSLKQAGSPSGGRGQAISNRVCYFEQEQLLEKELIAIKKLVDDTVTEIKSW